MVSQCVITFDFQLTIFFLFTRITEQILTKLGTKHPWVKIIQVYSNERPRPFPRGDDKEKAKYNKDDKEKAKIQ